MTSRIFQGLAMAIPFSIAATLVCGFGGDSDKTTQQQSTQRESWTAFEDAVPVLTSPRCLNCHARGDQPPQGDAMLPHNMGILRGPDGHGSAPLHCAACHQAQNIAALHSPPGTDDWHMPGSAMPMVWQGLSPKEICLVLTDPQSNGHRDIEQVIDHLDTGLVRWGWNPGPGRSTPPLAYDVFVGKMKEWKQKGAACSSQ